MPPYTMNIPSPNAALKLVVHCKNRGPVIKQLYIPTKLNKTESVRIDRVILTKEKEQSIENRKEKEGETRNRQ